MIEVIAFIIVFVWLVGLTVWALKVPKQIDEYCGVTARMVTNNVSDWLRNHLAMYRHEEAKAEDLLPPAVDCEKLAQKILETNLDINPKTGRPYKTSKKVREAQAKYRHKKRGRK